MRSNEQCFLLFCSCQVCSSAYASDVWRLKLTANLAPDLFIYDKRDYRRFLPAHLRFLSELCTISMQSVNGSIQRFLSSSLITTELKPPIEFREHIQTQLEQSKFDAPATFARLVSSTSAINHGNAIISTYGTNFKYYFPQWYEAPDDFGKCLSVASESVRRVL